MVPQIVTGARGPDDKMAPAVDSGPRHSLSLRPGEVEYHSRYPNLRVQLTSPHDVVDPRTGIKIQGRPKALIFHHGSAVAPDVELQHRVEGCPDDCKVHKERYTAHVNYGMGRDFWRADKALKQAKQKSLDHAVEVFKQNPEAVHKLLAELGVEDVKLPQRPNPTGIPPAQPPVTKESSKATA